MDARRGGAVLSGGTGARRRGIGRGSVVVGSSRWRSWRESEKGRRCEERSGWRRGGTQCIVETASRMVWMGQGSADFELLGGERTRGLG